MNKETWEERFDEEFNIGEENNGIVFRRKGEEFTRQIPLCSIKAFIRQEKELSRKEERARIVGVIEDYFKGLIMIPSPQLTKESLIQKINQENK